MVTHFVVNPLWDEARWNATTFRWHPTSDGPPVMGLCFDNARAAHELFGGWFENHDNNDSLEELRVSIIEGEIPGLPSGYTVHICTTQNALARATMEGVVLNAAFMVVLGRMNRMHSAPGAPPLLTRFKQEFQKHNEFLLAPVTRRGDGQLWVDLELGIVKRKIYFRHISEIGENDIDAAVLRPTLLGT